MHLLQAQGLPLVPKVMKKTEESNTHLEVMEARHMGYVAMYYTELAFGV